MSPNELAHEFLTFASSCYLCGAGLEWKVTCKLIEAQAGRPPDCLVEPCTCPVGHHRSSQFALLPLDRILLWDRCNHSGGYLPCSSVALLVVIFPSIIHSSPLDPFTFHAQTICDCPADRNKLAFRYC